MYDVYLILRIQPRGLVHSPATTTEGLTLKTWRGYQDINDIRLIYLSHPSDEKHLAEERHKVQQQHPRSAHNRRLHMWILVSRRYLLRATAVTFTTKFRLGLRWKTPKWRVTKAAIKADKLTQENCSVQDRQVQRLGYHNASPKKKHTSTFERSEEDT